jgi:uncharacterized SAM-binding protein YcdF (DUF218 family)
MIQSRRKYHLLLLIAAIFIIDAIVISIIESVNSLTTIPFALGVLTGSFAVYKILTNRREIFKVKIIRIAVTAIVSVLIFSFVVIEILIIINGNKSEYSIKEVDYIMVLGGGIKDEKPGRTLTKRLEKAIEIATEYRNIEVIVTGGTGQGHKSSEGFIMKEYLIRNGIEAKRIIIEGKSQSTYENMLFSKELMKNKTDKTGVIIITNSFHIYRAKILAERVGFIAFKEPCKTPAYITFNAYLREYFTMIKTIILDYNDEDKWSKL